MIEVLIILGCAFMVFYTICLMIISDRADRRAAKMLERRSYERRG